MVINFLSIVQKLLRQTHVKISNSRLLATSANVLMLKRFGKVVRSVTGVV